MILDCLVIIFLVDSEHYVLKFKTWNYIFLSLGITTSHIYQWFFLSSTDRITWAKDISQVTFLSPLTSANFLARKTILIFCYAYAKTLLLPDKFIIKLFLKESNQCKSDKILMVYNKSKPSISQDHIHVELFSLYFHRTMLSPRTILKTV